MNTKQLRQKILDLAIRGKLVPQDPNDEPASVLLERIQAEKEKLIKEGKIKRNKKEASVFVGDDKLHYEQLPDGWELIQLGDVIELFSGQDLTPDRYNDMGVGIPYITGASCLENNRVIINRWTDRPQVHSCDGDLLLTVKGAGVGKMAISHLADAHIARQIMAIRAYCGIDNRFIGFVLSAELSALTSQANGLIPGIRREIILTHEIALPPLAEQRRIVAAIESAFAVIDEIERNKTDLQAAVAAAKSKILDLAIRGKLVPQDPDDESAGVLLERIQEKKERLEKEGAIKRTKSLSPILDDELPFHIPKRWKWSRLGNIAFYKKGPFGSSITKSMFVPDSETVIKVYEQKNAIGKDHTLGTYYINSEKFNELQGFEVFPNDIIVSCAGTIGEAYVMPVSMRKGIINQALMRVMLYEIGMTDFYLLYFDFMLKNTAQDDSKGTAMKNIPPFDILKQYLIPIPPLAEQQRIVSAIEAAFKQLDRIAGILI